MQGRRRLAMCGAVGEGRERQHNRVSRSITVTNFPRLSPAVLCAFDKLPLCQFGKLPFVWTCFGSFLTTDTQQPYSADVGALIHSTISDANGMSSFCLFSYWIRRHKPLSGYSGEEPSMFTMLAITSESCFKKMSRSQFGTGPHSQWNAWNKEICLRAQS